MSSSEKNYSAGIVTDEDDQEECMAVTPSIVQTWSASTRVDSDLAGRTSFTGEETEPAQAEDEAGH